MKTPVPRLLGIIAGFIMIAAVVGAWRWGSGEPKRKSLTAPVRVALVERQAFPITEHAVATVLANASVQVTARVQGEIIRVNFREGQMVHRGDLLFEIDPEPYFAAVSQARAILTRDEALLRNAAQDRARFQKLALVNATSAQQMDAANANAAALAGTVAADQAALKVASLNLGYTKVHSPIDGKTGPILVYPGNMITNAGATALVAISQLQPVKISFNLPEQDFVQVHLGPGVKPLTVVLDRTDSHGQPIKAQAGFIGNQVDAQSGTVELRATVNNDDFSLLPGQTVNVTLTLRTFLDVLVVPITAINHGPSGDYLFVVRDAKAALSPVRVLASNADAAAVSGTVKPGDRVIVEGQIRVTPGRTVVIVKPQRSFLDGQNDSLADGMKVHRP